MGISLVWLAAQGIDTEEFLERLAFEDTGEIDPYFEHDHSGGALPGGWYVILSGDMGLIETGKLAKWSAGARLVAVAVHEETQTSLASEWREGRLAWSASHDGAEGGDRLDVEGELPALFEELRREAEALAAEAGSASEDGAFSLAFSLPLDLAADITGFRHDEIGFDDDIGPFTVLERLFSAGE
jgi:hypothetical protein